MYNTNKEASYIVSNEILSQKGKFTIDDIYNKVVNSLLSLFDDTNKIFNFIVCKINSFCELGLIGKTEIYFYAN